ncbi:DUF3999 family protein [Providencia rettgeri]|uniref:DUF3999 family protein n=1 Tax=Providencia rettgeri TaxID=587 RepID=UPI0023AA2E3D|nr:DUF3999 family protein [Providencia rettgeri]
MSLSKYRGLLAVFSLSLLFSSHLYGENIQDNSPYNFYQGTEIEISDTNEPFYWLELPTNAYFNSAYPNTLQDVRVFNGTGDEVPSALFYDAEKSISKANVSFTPQHLVVRLDNVNTDEDMRRDRQYLLVESIPGKVNRLELPNTQAKDKAFYQAYLLTRNENQEKNAAIKNLTLDWAKQNNDWQAKVFIFSSYDKEKWVNIATNQPIMNLTLNEQTVASNQIELLNGNAQALSAPYLLVVAASASDVAIPSLSKVTASADVLKATRRQESFHFEMTNDGVSREHVIYQLPSMQPLDELQIQLQQSNRVIPLKVEYSSDRGENWLPLTNIVAYNQYADGETVSNASIILHGEMIRTLRISALKGSWEDQPPRIVGKRDALNVIFNVQGAAPYLLVWGNKQASQENLTYNQLVGKTYTVAELMSNYPVAYPETEIVPLGGVERLTTTDPADESSNWLTIALWVLLFIGIIVLLYFCWYLLKEVNSGNKDEKGEL